MQVTATDTPVESEKPDPAHSQLPATAKPSITEELEQLRRHYGENGGNSAAVLLQIQQMEALVAKQQQQQQQQQLQQLQQQQQLFQMQQQQQLFPSSVPGEPDRDRQVRMLEQEVQLMKRKMELDTMLQSIQQQQMQLQKAWTGESALNPVRLSLFCLFLGFLEGVVFLCFLFFSIHAWLLTLVSSFMAQPVMVSPVWYLRKFAGFRSMAKMPLPRGLLLLLFLCGVFYFNCRHFYV
jgi:hypothetical protein